MHKGVKNDTITHPVFIWVDTGILNGTDIEAIWRETVYLNLVCNVELIRLKC